MISLTIALLAFGFLLVFTQVNQAQATVALSGVNQRAGEYKLTTLLSATTTSATSTDDTSLNGYGYAVITGSKKVTALFTHGGVATTSSGGETYRLQVSPDGTNWYDYNDLRLNTVTPGNSVLAHVGTTTISVATSTTIAVMQSLGFYAVRCLEVETSPLLGVDGEHTCKIYAEF